MNAALDTPHVCRHRSMSHRPGGAAPLAANMAITGPQPRYERPYAPMYDAAIVNGSELERWHTPNITAFTAIGTRNRHRPRG